MSGFPEVHRPETDVAGRPLVMLHGGNVANRMWQPQLVALTDRLVFNGVLRAWLSGAMDPRLISAPRN
ncbi:MULTISPECIES: hypothetical protein [unclassified Micromonospora]|uniref:hypothetical protein n=1 Tax=unclassified Micromonospora TaxID=2617518 RepID=UPI00331E58A1